MKRIHILILLVTALAFTTVSAQYSQTRFQKQHNVTKFMKAHFNSSVEMMIRALENKESNLQLSAIQTIRELEQLFPEDPFDALIKPLVKLIQNESAEPEARILAIVTLDLLHSNVGDAAIFHTGKNTTNPVIRNICMAITKLTDENYFSAAQVK
ncbi:MAG: hypothetical protein ACM34K_10095 [Bacillota bacterium]